MFGEKLIVCEKNQDLRVKRGKFYVYLLMMAVFDYLIAID